MMNNLTTMYTELIFEHDKRPYRAGLREPFDAEVHHVNPTCGDEITLRLHLVPAEAEQRAAASEISEQSLRIDDLSYEVTGCAMSRASASMMAELLTGRMLGDAQQIHAEFDKAMNRRTVADADTEILGDAVALTGAAKFPGRVKCVVMAWKAYTAVLAESLLLKERSETGA